jgi:hypothetical protein
MKAHCGGEGMPPRDPTHRPDTGHGMARMTHEYLPRFCEESGGKGTINLPDRILLVMLLCGIVFHTSIDADVLENVRLLFVVSLGTWPQLRHFLRRAHRSWRRSMIKQQQLVQQ